jgi:hypothetical protein
LYARPGLVVRHVIAPLLVLPEDHDGNGLPGAVALGEVAATVRRLVEVGVRGVGWV